MTARTGVRVSSSTAGTPAPGYHHLSGGYCWHKTPGWDPAEVGAREASSRRGAAGASRSRSRLERFTVILAELSGGDPERASDAQIRKAGELVGVGERTARGYRKALLRQEESRNG